jgi:HAD superfamily hydrolase (TIGR01459 family)
MLKRQLLQVCANPDVMTEIGGMQVQCSGAVAEAYAEMGGRVCFTGKPHTEIFDWAMSAAAELRGTVVPPQRILVIGDSVRTDIAGAHCNGFDSLFILGGIHRKEFGERDSVSADALSKLFGEIGFAPTGTAWHLYW